MAQPISLKSQNNLSLQYLRLYYIIVSNLLITSSRYELDSRYISTYVCILISLSSVKHTAVQVKQFFMPNNNDSKLVNSALFHYATGMDYSILRSPCQKLLLENSIKYSTSSTPLGWVEHIYDITRVLPINAINIPVPLSHVDTISISLGFIL